MPIDETNKQKSSVLLTNTTEERKVNSPMVRFNEDDLVIEDKITLGTHVNKITQDPMNNQTYYIGSDGSYRETSIRDSDTGLPATIETDPNNTLSSTFFSVALAGSPDLERLKTRFDQNSNSQLFTIDGKEGFELIKGKQLKKSEKHITVEQLLLLQTTEQIVGKAISIRQQQTGRFSSENLYIDPNVKQTEESSGAKSFTIQKKLGSHYPTANFLIGDNSLNNSAEAQEITIDQLKNIGIQMLIKAGGEAYKPKDETDSKYASMIGRTLVPSLTRLGQRVNYDDFSAGNIMEQVNPNYSKPKNPILSDEDVKQKKSFGSPYNPFVPFDGFTSDAASVVAATAMALGITSVVLSVAKMFNGEKVQNHLRGLNSEGSDFYSARESILGVGTNSSKLPQQLDSGPGTVISGITGNRENFFGLVATKYDFFECVKKGLNTYFNPKSKTAKNIVFTSPNFANTILRTITRDLVDIGFNFASLGKNTNNLQGTLEVEAANNRDPQNIATTTDATFRMITEIRNNRLIKFINVLALLGEKVLEGEKIETYYDRAIEDSTSETTFGTNLNLNTFHKKSRLSSNVDKNAGSLSWTQNTIKSMYIKPKQIGIASQLYLNNLNAISHLTQRNSFIESDTNRLSGDLVTRLEEELNTSYMPFYFHDLRTNEIISFHAFLSSIADGYRADYEETEAYGRLGRVYKWKNTTRDDISLEFWLVSTNPQDFDEMWLKMNKLTMLTMPQYTEGRTIETKDSSNNDVKFVQPFSQIPASSPMIRMRLGDVFKTNYSKFDLARIFGVGNSNQFQIGESLVQGAQTAIGNAASNTGTGYNNLQITFDYINNGFVGKVPAETLTTLELQQDFFSYGANINGKTIYRPVMNPDLTNNEIDSSKRMLYKFAGENIEGKITVDSEVPNSVKVGDAYFVHNGMPGALFRPTEDYIKNVINQQTTSNSIESGDYRKIQTFFSTTDNAIFRAFESSKGEGLAGFIKDIKYNFEDGTVWSTEENKKAPTMVKISISFAPVFDLNPGLDVNGFMIGAPYNVGNIMNSLKNYEEAAPSPTAAGAAAPATEDGPTE